MNVRIWLCLLLGLGLPEQVIGWLPLRFGIGGGSPDDKPTEFSCYNKAKPEGNMSYNNIFFYRKF